ncbi:MAG: c-type cytochrome, partial [Cytophaga sp.]|uniref:c-type cytochrome n=1 Tax=Cytophaga sp. TaxID=29535 RepID=UPI003F7CDE47
MSRLPILMSRISRSFLTLAVFSIVALSSSFSAFSDTTATAASATANPALISQGEQLFKANCKSCHKIHTDAVGPALSGVTKRRKADWIYSWVHNSRKMIDAGDKTAVELYNKFNKAEMTSFPTLATADIDAILAYVESVPAETTPVVDPNAPKVDPNTPQGGQYDTVILSLIIVVLILVLVAMIIFLTVIKRYLKEREGKLDAEDKELVDQKFDIIALVKSKAFIGILIAILVIVSVRACWISA